MTNSATALLSGQPAAAATPTPAADPAAPAAGSPVPVTDQTGAALTTLAPTEPNAWHSGIKDEPIRNWAAAKGWKDPLSAVESAYNLEKLIGFDRAGKTIVVPDDKATPEQVQAFRAKLGVPEKPDGYKLPVPEGADPTFASEASKWFHEAGVPPKQAELLASKWNEYGAKLQADQAAAKAAQAEADLSDLKQEWAVGYDKQIELARRAARDFLPAKSDAERGELLTKLEDAMGAKAMLKFMASLGQGLGEARMIDNGRPGSYGAMTPEQAKQRIAELQSDKAWTTAYLNGDKAKLAEMENLSKMAVGVAP